MNAKFLLLASAATFAFASCSSDNKAVETTTGPPPAAVPDTVAQPPVAVDTLAYRAPADQLASQVANDIQVTDTATVHQIKRVYYNRGRIMAKIERMADTTGRYAALKTANDQTSQAMKATVPAPAYATYAAKESNYYHGPHTVASARPATTTVRKSSLAARVSQGSAVKKLENTDNDKKVKFENGAKIKRSDDGSLKIKRADGTKVKIDADGHRTVKKGLF